MDPNAGKKLINRLGRDEAIAALHTENFARRTTSFYRYVDIPDTEAMRDKLYREWSELGVFGRVYLANEGINAQISVPEPNWDKFIDVLNSNPEFINMHQKIAIEDDGKSFFKLMLKTKNQIVADGLEYGDYDISNVGTHLDAKAWNEAMDEGAIVVDMRNHYESEIGHFEGAICPQSETFREELPKVLENLKGKEDDKILLYCTGGIRCEKTSAYLKHHGFNDVNQLNGGIIDYARQLENNKDIENKFIGKNFVFDERLGERISDDIISNCHQCGESSDDHVNCKNKTCNLLFIQCEKCQKANGGCCSPECLEYSQLPEEEQILQRKGKKNNSRFHNHQKRDLSKGFK
ncbi:MAG: hypothetical protein CL823_01140 [Crocinitomicaceae bacterium]|nr:hypothetical protein [Crocinitomicaceae bacterium]|tara:strand:- start:3426 stop:4472 length:1047 start_codon:yes stop_codon:yes gene_type:complete